ncbi:uncharacterized protein LOC103312472 [Tribolium castaneum]|uniref:Uncharacterized protein n=1 Tax=Tribolium castaneum TaxID=7070 RepID=A0A139WK85_TRICA|nr:PREDICTED: uncharacterized protein LOC103312472 [Tribolium castaneum]KYB28314.1 hypothetical protein TcasGA2_TC031065 [Tribolium castaneum]|eukprot:XP_008191389.1 PREDICTED: uncharacterized protein LOC103312472 [Tribolium castaneum]
MTSEKEIIDWGEDFDESNYKSCFARSVAVNSQYKQLKTSEPRQLQQLEEKDSSQENFKRLSARPLPLTQPIVEEIRVRKNSSDDARRLSYSSVSNSRRTSICSSRISEIPVENIVQQSKVSTLQWQLKEVEKSREMYKAVMKQVVSFLEKAHRNLELLGHRLNSKQTVPRSKSEHQIVAGQSDTLNSNDDYSMFRDFTWRRPKKPETSSEEIPPEKLSQEAFRLLRTAQSLLNTQEPKLSNDTPDDLEFLAQLAKEFPQTPDPKPQRTTSFSLSPKLLVPERETRIATAFNRKLSLQLNETRRNSFKYSPRNSVIETPLLSSTLNDFKEHIILNNDKLKSEKSNSPPAGSISSVEDESGFSSMNSFQDVGLPVVGDEVTAKNVLLRSMLHNNVEVSDKNGNIEDDVKLWQKPDVAHKRWSSTPVNCSGTKQSLNVLWV